MQKIVPHLWFDKEAKEAAEFYVAALGGDSKVTNVSTIHGTPSGSVDIVSFALLGHAFMGISAGPIFKPNPSISFLVACSTKEEVDTIWNKMSQGGSALMELGTYPFSERYGWIQDRYGFSWQIMFFPDKKTPQRVVPSFLFVGNVYGKAEEAMKLYASVFKDARIDHVLRYEKNEAPDKEGAVKHAAFTLEGQEFAAMDSAHEHKFAFNEAVSLMVYCDTQEEIDHYWDALSAVPEAEQCGWLKDAYGVSWQIVPREMDAMMRTGTTEQVARVTEAFLKMKKFDIATLQKAYDGV